MNICQDYHVEDPHLCYSPSRVLTLRAAVRLAPRGTGNAAKSRGRLLWEIRGRKGLTFHWQEVFRLPVRWQQKARCHDVTPFESAKTLVGVLIWEVGDDYRQALSRQEFTAVSSAESVV